MQRWSNGMMLTCLVHVPKWKKCGKNGEVAKPWTIVGGALEYAFWVPEATCYIPPALNEHSQGSSTDLPPNLSLTTNKYNLQLGIKGLTHWIIHVFCYRMYESWAKLHKERLAQLAGSAHKAWISSYQRSSRQLAMTKMVQKCQVPLESKWLLCLKTPTMFQYSKARPDYSKQPVHSEKSLQIYILYLHILQPHQNFSAPALLEAKLRAAAAWFSVESSYGDQVLRFRRRRPLGWLSDPGG